MKLWILGTSFVLFLVALPLVSWGTWQDVDAAWYTGLGLMAVAAVLPPLTRFQSKTEKKDDGKDDGKQGQEGSSEKDQDDSGQRGQQGGGSPGRSGGDGSAGAMQGSSPGASPRSTSERAKLQKRKAEAATKNKERS